MGEKNIGIEIYIVIRHKSIRVCGRFNIIFRFPHYDTIVSIQIGEVQGSC